VLRGAREHNLKGFDLVLPHRRLVVVTGVSGSGKSSLAFDTLFAEGQRRYLESFSPRARQALGKLHRPDLDGVEGLPPALAVSQSAVVRSSRSTVGTLTGLYDHLRLLFARVGQREGRERPGAADTPLTSSLFSFNTPLGACPRCTGLGVEDQVAPELLVADGSRSLRGGALVPTTPNGYIVYSQVTLEVLDTVCRAHGFDVDTPWNQLSEEQQGVVLYGSQQLRVPFGKHPLESRLRWEGITAQPREEGFYKGIVPTIEEIIRRTRNRNALRFVRTTACGECDGARLNPAALGVTIAGRTIAEVAATSLGELPELLAQLAAGGQRPELAEAVVTPMVARLAILDALGLSHLTLDRGSVTLSRGEAQRLRLGTQAVVGLTGMLYVLDEPSIGLHSTDIHRLQTVLRPMLDTGCSLVVVDHAPETIASADWLVDMGPGPGELGGEVLFNGPPPWRSKGREATTPEATTPPTPTLDFALGRRSVTLPARRHPAAPSRLELCGVTKHNLQGVDLHFELGRLNAVTGVSGAGKSTLVFDALVPAVEASHGAAHGAAEQRDTCFDELRGGDALDSIIAVTQSAIGRTPRSNPATYTKVFDPIRALFAAEPAARAQGFGKSHFSLNTKGGRCEACHGAGVQTVGMHFLGDVAVRCGSCDGRRFGDELLAIRHRGRSIRDVLEMSVSDARELFQAEPRITRILDAMIELGLGYLRLGQPSTTLSGGEAQRIKLASQLAKKARGHCLYVLDEPTSGLHQADVETLIHALSRLVDGGHTVVVLEHDLDVLRAADWIVDLGPGGGAAGGRVVAMGPPASIGEVADSKTGQALRGPSAYEEVGAPREPAGQERPAGEGITLTGVRTHNLAGIDVHIPNGSLTVVTGRSGSGKSSLAMDTIAELGFRRFAESLPAFARRFISLGRAAEVDNASGLGPTLAIGPGRVGNSPRSTVGTMTGALDPLRLLFARAATRGCPRCGVLLDDRGHCTRCDFVGLEQLTASAFSFNHELGACPRCRGLGFVTTCDPEKLVSQPDRPLAGGAMDGHKSGRFYGDPRGQHMAILAAVGTELGIDFSVPWGELDDQARSVALQGTGTREYDVRWHYQRKSRSGEHRWTTTWRGLCAEVDAEYERKHADRRGASMRSIMRDIVCSSCDGTRLNAELRVASYQGRRLPQLLALSVSSLLDTITGLRSAATGEDLRARAAQAALQDVTHRIGALADLGLGYLPLDRRAADLSAGETARVRLAGQLNAGLCHLTYVFDEPTRGLHPRDAAHLVRALRRLRDEGNTVIVVEHDLQIVEAADHVLELGPGGGASGGRLVFAGSVAALREAKNTATGPYLAAPAEPPADRPIRQLAHGLTIEGPGAKNLKGEDVTLPRDGLIAITGVSGSGKSTLLFDVLEPSARTGRPVGCAALRGFAESFDELRSVDQSPLSSGAASTPATVTGVFDLVRAAFAQTAEARAKGFGKARFSFAGKAGGCNTCGGLGRERIEMGFLPTIWTECVTCHGSRYEPETLTVTLDGRTIAEVLDLTFAEAAESFEKTGKLGSQLGLLVEVGLGYLRLGQPASSLSGGEAQRLRLGTELLQPTRGSRSLYLLDEPTTGLHACEVADLLRLLTGLVDQGHTVVAIEHDVQVMRAADWLIDLGPEGGDGGGRVLDQGTPEEVMARGLGPTAAALRALG